ncbi:hypothetical protein KAH81_09910 [bacterium]|nr:hypothetical protein [bacterium]
MSADTVTNIIGIQNCFQRDFDKEFGFISELCSEIWGVAGKIGLDRTAMKVLDEANRKFVIAVIQIVTTADTALSASLALLRVGLPAESLAMQRVVHEAGIIIRYMSLNEDNKWRVLLSFPTKSNINAKRIESLFSESERKDLWKAVRTRALNYILQKFPKRDQYREQWDLLNKQGAHLTPERMIQGGADILGDQLVSRAIMPRMDNAFFLALNLHPCSHLFCIEAMCEFFKCYKPSEAIIWKAQCSGLMEKIVKDVLPKLKKKANK